MQTFDQAAYWRERVSGKLGLVAVGHRALGAKYNEWIYRRRLDVLDSLLTTTMPVTKSSAVLDLGCGSGFYETFWQACGIERLRGIDVSAANIATLQKFFPAYEFAAGDLTEEIPTVHAQYDIVTIFDVLYHLVRDEDASNAIAYAGAHLAPGGRLLIFDQLLSKDYQLRKHVKFRARSNFDSMLAAHGLVVESEVPLFVFLEPPLCGVPTFDRMIAGLYFIAGLMFRAVPPIGNVAGRLAYAIDAVLMRRGFFTKNHSLFVVRSLPKQ